MKGISSVLKQTCAVAAVCTLLFCCVSGEPLLPLAKNIVVSAGGVDNATCLTGETDCKTLTHALQGLENSTSITVTYSHEFLPTSAMYVVAVSNIAILGEGFPTIECSKGAGISLVSTVNIVVGGIKWVGCSISHPSTCYQPEMNISFPNITSALFLHHCLNVTINNCTFTSGRGSGVSMYDVGGEILIEHSEFRGQSHNCTNDDCLQISRGLLIEHTYCGQFQTCMDPFGPSPYNSGSVYTIRECRFIMNNNMYQGMDPTSFDDIMHSNLYWPFGKGGGLALVVRGRSSGNTFTIVGPTEFSSNEAKLGGAMSIELLDQASNNTIVIQGEANFTGNSGWVGGALLMQAYLFDGYSVIGNGPGDNSISIADSLFANNLATTWGGALAFQTNGQVFRSQERLLSFINCNWINNSADAGAALGIFLEYHHEVHELNPVLFASNTLTSNGKVCALSTDQIPLLFNGSTRIEKSSESGLCVSSASVHMAGEVTFKQNFGKFGAAISLWGSSWIIIHPGLNLTFQDNYGWYGGAVYLNSLPSNNAFQKYGTMRHCIFEYQNDLIPVDQWETNVKFINNSILPGGSTGKSIYISNTYTCIRGNNSIILLDDHVFTYYPNRTEQLATPAAELILHSPVSVFNNTPYMDIMLGQNIMVNVTTIDYFNNTVETTVNVNFWCEPYSKDGPYGISGSKAIVVENSEISTQLYIYGPEKHDPDKYTCFLLIAGADLSAVFKIITVNFNPPKFGFVYSSHDKIYQCFDSEHIYCNTTSLEVCIHNGYWYGQVASSTNTSMASYTVVPCPSGFCKFSNGRCSTSPCDQFHTFCELPQIQDEQCSANRGGTLCAGCKANYSFTYDALHCVPSTTCSAGHFVLLFTVIIIFWILVITGLLLVLRLNMRVGSGYMYSFLFYFSVVQYYLPANLPTSALTVIVITFTSFAQLDPRFLGLVPLCVIEELGGLGHTALRYFHPFFISLAILLIVLLARRYPRFLHLAKYSSIHAICLLILLSFASVSETSLTLLSPVKLDDQAYVRVDPSIAYFDPKQHLPYALIALLVEIIIVIPIIVVLLTAPLLVKCVNLTKIKPILDHYQACYRSDYRWMAGFYFLARQIVFLVSIFHFGSYGSIYILQIVTIVIVVFHTALQPYTFQWLNILDAVLLTDLVFLSLLYGGTADIIFKHMEAVRSAFNHILILIPCVYFLVVLVMLLATRLKVNFSSWSLRKRKYQLQPPGECTVQTPSMSFVQSLELSSDRDSLLVLLEDADRTRYNATAQENVN